MSAGPTSPRRPPPRRPSSTRSATRPRSRSSPSRLPIPASPRATSTSSSATGCRRWRPISHPTARQARSRRCGTNLVGAKYTLATNEAGANLGITDFGNIAEHEDELDGKIYGIEPGNDGNRLILDMISNDHFGLSAFELIESSEQGMLAQVAKADGDGRADRLPRLGTASDERQLQDDLPVGRRRCLRPELRRRRGRDQHPRGLCGRMPEYRQAPAQPRIHARDGERDHGRDPQ